MKKIDFIVSSIVARLDNLRKGIRCGLGVANSTQSLVVGVSGPQGSGKSTACRQVAQILSERGLRVAVLSLDDLYLTRAEQQVCAAVNNGNRLLQLRGLPGTHDLDLGRRLLQLLKHGHSSEGKQLATSVRLPGYNKAAFGGLGDRTPVEQWTTVQLPVDVVLFEGWMIGFRAVSDADIEKIRNASQHPLFSSIPTDDSHEKSNTFVSTLLSHSMEHVRTVNENLKSYENSLYSFLDMIVCFSVPDIRWVYEWREQQEEETRRLSADADGRKMGGMTPEQVRDFVDRYMPAYELYANQLWTSNFFGSASSANNHINIQINRQREMVSTSCI